MSALGARPRTRAALRRAEENKEEGSEGEGPAPVQRALSRELSPAQSSSSPQTPAQQQYVNVRTATPVVPYGTRTEIPAPARLRVDAVEGDVDVAVGSSDTMVIKDLHQLLKVPPLDGTNFDDWDVCMQTLFLGQNLKDLVCRKEPFDDRWPEKRKVCWQTRYIKAHTMLVGAMSPEMRKQFRAQIVTGDPRIVWEDIVKTYDTVAQKSWLTLNRELMDRFLKKGESLDAYTQDMMRLVTEMRRAGGDLRESAFIELVFANSVGVYPKAMDAYKDMIEEADRHREEPSITLARKFLFKHANEIQQQDHISQSVRKPGQGQTRGVNYTAGGQGGSARDKRRSVSQGKERSSCYNCGKTGHWARECDQPPKEDEEQKDQNQNSKKRSQSSNRGRGNQKKKKSHYGDNSGDSGSGSARVLMVKVGSVAPPSGGGAQQHSSVIEWKLDSGSQANLCGVRDCFVKLQLAEDPLSLEMMDGSSVVVDEIGTVALRLTNEVTGVLETCHLDNVWYTPSARVNLISQGDMRTRGFKVSYSNNQKTTYLSKKGIKIKFQDVDGIACLWTPAPKSKRIGSYGVIAVKRKAEEDVDATTWHKRPAQAGDKTIEEMAKSGAVEGLKVNNETSAYDCVPCDLAKAKFMHFREKTNKAEHPLERLCADLCSVESPTKEGYTQFLHVVDEYSRFRWVFLLVHKNEANRHIQALIKKLNNQFKDRKLSVITMLSDQGGEFINGESEKYCEDQGISLITTNGYSPQENGLVERGNGLVMTKVRAILGMTRLPFELWGDALLYVTDTVNVTGTRVLKGKTPHELFFGTVPGVHHLRTWGCVVLVTIPPLKRKKKEKLQDRSTVGVLLGYSKTTVPVSYVVLDAVYGTTHTARGGNLKFKEKYTVDGSYLDRVIQNAYGDEYAELPAEPPFVRMRADPAEMTPPLEELAQERSEFTGQSEVLVPKQVRFVEPEEMDGPSSEKEPASEPVGVEKSTEKTSSTKSSSHLPAEVATDGRPRRKKKAPARLSDYQVHHLTKAQLKRKLRGLKAAINAIAMSKAKPRGTIPDEILHADDVPVPTSYSEAMKDKRFADYWRAATEEEMESLRRHAVYVIVERVKVRDKKAIITNKWVFAIKKDENGIVKRFKARLVVHGYKQIYGVNYFETYAPVIRFETIRVAIYFAIQRGWCIMQYDVKTAFLHGTLSEDVYMEQPTGFGAGGKAKVCKLLKSLYGLKQAPMVWNQRLHEVLEGMGFTRVQADYGLYAKVQKGEVTMLLTVYVDDLLLMRPQHLCDATARQLESVFELVAMGPVKYLLGVEIVVDRASRTVFMSQEAYIEEILKRFTMHQCRGTSTPEGVTDADVEKVKDGREKEYPAIVGALQYLVSGSRPDLAHVVRHLGQFMSKVTKYHYAQALKVLRYLRKTTSYGLVLVISEDQLAEPVDLVVYTDADYANDKDDRRSVSGYVTLLNGATVSYGSRKQGINALSTMEAEYIAMSEGVRDILWLRKLCGELLVPMKIPRLMCDNQAAIVLTTKPGKHHKSKHIDNKYHFVRLLVAKNELRIQHVGTNDMIADTMTKGLSRVKFERFRDLLGVVSRDTFVEAKAVISADNDESVGANDIEEADAQEEEQGQSTMMLFVGLRAG